MKLRLVTWNLWNSFRQIRSPIEIEFLEPWQRIYQRYKMQESWLQSKDVDVFLLQEVNPFFQRRKRWEKDFVSMNSQIDQGGLRLFGYGIPANFQNALVNLSQHPLKKISSPRLSREWACNTAAFSLQWQEARYALISELDLYDERLLLVNTHLHHGIEWTNHLEKVMQKLKSQIDKQVYDDFIYEISLSAKKRKEQLQKLMHIVGKLQKHYHKIVIAGDFNLSEDAADFEIIRSRGFRHYHLNPEYSWSREENYENIVYTNQILSQSTPKALHEVLVENTLRSKNLDHFFVSESLEVRSLEAYGNEKGSQNFLPSDHLGVKIELEL
tara:strand:+ start:12730 stop:13710 length:981 start_codon:yes stop_codon:yes gene_type:complete